MEISGDNLVALATLIFGAGGVYKGIEKGIGYWWKKRQDKLGKSCQYAKTSDCALLHEGLITRISEMLIGFRSDVKKDYDDLTKRFDSTASKIEEMTQQRTFEDGIKRKHDVIVANAISFMSNNKGVHDFALHKADRFKTFILDNYKTMWSGSFEIFKERIGALAISVKEEGKVIASVSYVNFFYDYYHKSRTDSYLEDVKEIFKDKVNNKSERFIDTSMMFMQKFLSDMVDAYVKWMEHSFEMEKVA